MWSDSVMNVMERKEELTRIAKREEERKPHVAIAAIAELNVLENAYAPNKKERQSERVVIKTLEYFGPNNPRPPIISPNPPQIAAP